MPQALSIGLTALRVNQRLLDLTGQNIANANTPGYHRQVATLATRTTGEEIGNGVEVQRIRRLQNRLLDDALVQNSVETNETSAQLTTLRQIQTQLDAGDGSVHDLVEKFFNGVEQLAAQPGDLAQRRVVLGSGLNLTNKLNSLANDLDRTREGLTSQVRLAVGEVNTLSPQIAALNETIQRNSLQGVATNDLEDQRDQLISQLAELADVRTVQADFGQLTVIAAGTPVVIGNQSLKLSTAIDSDNRVLVTAAGSQTELDVTGGQLGGFLAARNERLLDFRDRLDTLANTLARTVDTVHATGLGLKGPVNRLAGARDVNNVNAPLGDAGLAFPPSTGTLTVSVTELATGRRVNTDVAINPGTQSLQDVANSLSGIPNIQGVVDSQTRTLQIVASPGYAFDFAGRLPTEPETLAVTGTSAPAIGGSYTGAANDAYTFQVVGSGTVGVTPGLTLEARNSAGNLLASYNVGQGYEPGTALPPVNGVAVKLETGTVNAGDSFGTRVVAAPDTAGVLTALGLNTFFQGDSVSDLTVRSDLADNPDLLAAGKGGGQGDATNLRALAGLRDRPLFSNGTESFRQFYASIVGDVGIQVRELGQKQSAQQVLTQRLEAERQSVSGVDVNEELVQLLQYQRSFQLAARYISVIDESLNELVNIIR